MIVSWDAVLRTTVRENQTPPEPKGKVDKEFG